MPSSRRSQRCADGLRGAPRSSRPTESVHGYHYANEEQPCAISAVPQKNAAGEQRQRGNGRNPGQRPRKTAIREVTERHAAVERRQRQQVEQPEQGTRAGEPVCAERVCQCGQRKAGGGPGEADGGARKRRRRQAVRQSRCTVPPARRSTSRCPHSWTAAASRNSGSTPLSSAHQSAASSTAKPSRTSIRLTAR